MFPHPWGHRWLLQEQTEVPAPPLHGVPQGAGRWKCPDPQQEQPQSFGHHHHLAGDTAGGGGEGLLEDAGTADGLADQRGLMRSVPLLTALVSSGPHFPVVTAQALAQRSRHFSHPEEWLVM